MRASEPPQVKAIYEKHERAGLYKNGDRYPEEYQNALDLAYEPVTIRGEPPEYLAHMFAKVAYDVYRVMWGEESEFRVTGTLKEFDTLRRLDDIRVPTLVSVGASDMPT